MAKWQVGMFIAIGMVIGAALTFVYFSANAPASFVAYNPTIEPTRAGYFTADTTVIPAGGCVTLSWAMPGAESLVLTGSNWPEGTSETVSNPGTAQACPSAAARYVPDEPVNYTLIAQYPDGREEVWVITITYQNTYLTATTPFITPTSALVIGSATPPSIGQPTPFPTETPIYVAARYQTFERGFMLQRAGETCVFAFSTDIGGESRIVIPRAIAGQPFGDYSYCLPFEELPIKAYKGNVPSGLSIPTGVFGQVWGFYDEVRAALGFAVEKELWYAKPMPPMPPAISGAPFSTPIATLPDGRVFSCGYRAASVGCRVTNP